MEVTLVVGRDGRAQLDACSEPAQDLQIARTWARRWGELRVAFDWLNFTFQREPIAWYCHSPWNVRAGQPECEPEYLEFPITLPMLGIRGTF